MAESEAAQAGQRNGEAAETRFLAGLRDGLPEAFAELHDRFASGLHRFAASRLPEDMQLAEDMVVQTLAKAVRNITDYDPRRATLAAWLYGIARWQIWEEIRRRKRGKSVPKAAVVPINEVAEDQGDRDLAAEAAARLDAQRQVRELAGLLSHTEMEVLVLQCVDELSVKDISHIVRRSERAVHSLLHRARQKAREGLVQDAE
ncbi:MAG: sigma-70 family RNA polymerase sigma factor [Armatimonadota bacterium]|nr:MAG: sigma-70 family RNA polymerase sigma factor [Armatimonadota bacterium]